MHLLSLTCIENEFDLTWKKWMQRHSHVFKMRYDSSEIRDN